MSALRFALWLLVCCWTLALGAHADSPCPSLLVALEEARLVASDATSGDQLGLAVAIDGDTALVGAPRSRVGGVAAGAVYVFERVGGVWSQSARLTHPSGASATDFGASVALDGDTALVGAPAARELGDPAGVAFVFVRAGATWSPQARLSAGDPLFVEALASAVDLEGDSAVLGDPDAGLASQGAAYVFTRVGASWSLQGSFGGDAPGVDADFGNAVAISAETVLVGAPYDDQGGTSAGAGYVFDRVGGSWVQTQKLLSSLGAHSFFGRAVALDGDTALVGSSTRNVVQVYLRTGTSWIPQQELHPGDAPVANAFGVALAIEGDRALVGAYLDDQGCGGGFECNAGAAYLFERSGVGWGTGLKLIASDAAQLDRFGSAVGLSGARALVGAPWDAGLALQPGAAYVYVVPPPPGIGFCFGDPGSGTPCPCANDNDGSLPGSGCANGVFASGAHLDAGGLASVSGDSVVLRATGLEPNNTGLYLQGDDRVNAGAGLVFGDGLRCAGTAVVRLQVRASDPTGVSCTSVALGVVGSAQPGDTKRYQCWYRTTVNPPCGVGVNNFNLTNGYELTWSP